MVHWVVGSISLAGPIHLFLITAGFSKERGMCYPFCVYKIFLAVNQKKFAHEMAAADFRSP